MRYFEHLRRQWVLEQLEIYGFIGRGHVVRKFGVTPQVASKDFTELQAATDVMFYDKHTKRYYRANELGQKMLKTFRRSIARDILNGETSQ